MAREAIPEVKYSPLIEQLAVADQHDAVMLCEIVGHLRCGTVLEVMWSGADHAPRLEQAARDEFALGRATDPQCAIVFAP